MSSSRAQIQAAGASADALDDDFEIDVELLADEDADFAGGSRPLSSKARGKRKIERIDVEEEDEFDLDGEDDDEQDGEARAVDQEDVTDVEDEYGLPVGKKRKIDSADDEGKDSKGQAQNKLSKEDKKRKRKEKQKAAKRKKLSAIDDAEAEYDTSLIAVQPPALQADFMAEMQAQATPKMSSMEMEDFRVTETFLLDTTSITSRPSIKDFIKQAIGLQESDLKAESLSKAGSPKIIVISGAGIRSADVVRDLRPLAGKGEVSKLFAKHFKLAEHIQHCQKTKFSLGAGTPDRILKLIDADALLLDNLSHLVLDMKKDSKKRNLLDIPESRQALYRLLAHEKLNSKLKEGSLRLVMF